MRVGSSAAVAGGSLAWRPAAVAGLACGQQRGAEDAENMAPGRRMLRSPLLATAAGASGVSLVLPLRWHGLTSDLLQEHILSPLAFAIQGWRSPRELLLSRESLTMDVAGPLALRWAVLLRVNSCSSGLLS